jgi:hypothetical protein
LREWTIVIKRPIKSPVPLRRLGKGAGKLRGRSDA